MRKNLQAGGSSGMIYVVVILATLIAFSFHMVGGKLPQQSIPTTTSDQANKQEIVFEQVKDPGKKNLQLQTFTVKNTCENKMAVDFLIDVSGSMRENNKIGKEKDALKAFSARMNDTSVIGIQTFSSSVQEKIPLSYYKDVKGQVQNTINSLPANGWTSTRSAFELAHQKLSGVISQNKFPGYKYALILLSDGVPETADGASNPKNCLLISNGRCFALAQDPRVPTNLSTDVKNLGVSIYSIAITSSGDKTMEKELIQLLQDLSSDPDSKFFYNSIDGNNLTTVLDNVFNDICKQ